MEEDYPLICIEDMNTESSQTENGELNMDSLMV